MDDKYLLICIDNLESLSSLFKKIREKSPFNVDLVTISDILSDKYTEKLKSFRPYDVFIAIDGNKFDKDEQSLREYCNKLEESTPFTNFLYLYNSSSSYDNQDFLKGNKNRYILFNTKDPLHQALQFNLFMINLFNKSVLANRLADYIYHSFKEVVYYEMLKKQKADIEELNKELARINKIDNLTSLYNRRALFDFLEKERNRTLRSIQKLGAQGFHFDENVLPVEENEEENKNEEEYISFYSIFSIMMIDLDHFKQINDTHGHLVGDKVLKTIGKLLKQDGIFRDQDIAGRFGGEEFIVILPNTNANSALGPAIRLADELGKIEFKGSEKKRFKVTLSIGISEYHPPDRDNEAIIYRADQAMYYAKEHGRNQIIIYEKVFNI